MGQQRSSGGLSRRSLFVVVWLLGGCAVKHPDPPDEPTPAPASNQACSPARAQYVAAYHSYIGGDDVNVEQAMSASCDGGYPTACDWVATSLLLGRHVPVDKDASHALEAKNEPLLDASCKKGCTADCATFGYKVFEHTGGADFKQAVSILDAACSAGDADGCRTLALVLEQGEFPIPEEPVRAFSKYKTACKLGDASSCGDVAYAFEKGKIVHHDPARAHEYYAQSCKLGFAKSCGK